MRQVMDETRAIIITYDDKTRRVSFDDYVKAKLKSLREFGYPDLTLDEVISQADKVLSGETKMGEGKLNVIGMLMVDEIKEASDG